MSVVRICDIFFFSSRRRHTICSRDWSSDVCSSDLCRPDTLEVKWLLNLAYMTLGKYPAGVPAKYLIPPSAFQSKETIGRFVDVAPAAGLDKFSMAGGTIVDDFDNDGLLDVVTSSYYHCEPLHFFHNNGDGTFTDRAAE